MNRIVFDVSRKLGKDIEFVMVGEQTEVDKKKDLAVLPSPGSYPCQARRRRLLR